jgi:4-amino-4-deoxy-L-arabinose transferase-like glycosyltransferase
VSRGTEKFLLALVLAGGLAIRIGWAARQPNDLAALSTLPDQREYLELGTHLRDHEGLWFADPRFLGPVYAYRTPGYPAFIALCKADPRIIRIAQAVLDATTILAIYLLTKKIPRRFVDWPSGGGEGHLIPLLAAAIIAANPFLIFFSGLILSETLFTAMLAWGMLLLIASGGPWPTDRRRLFAWLAGCLLLVLSLLVRPGAILLPVLLACAAAIVTGSSRRRLPLPVAATILLLMAIVLFPWAARNRLQLKEWIWTTTNAGITRYDGFNPDATGASDQSFVKSMPFLEDMTESARSRYFEEKADDWIRQNPGQAASLALVKIGRTWSPIPLSDQYGSRRLYVLVGLCFSLPVDLLLIVGLRRKGLPRAVKMFLLIPAIYFTVGSALSVGSLRYLLPAQPPMAILAASALSRISIRSRSPVLV